MFTVNYAFGGCQVKSKKNELLKALHYLFYTHKQLTICVER